MAQTKTKAGSTTPTTTSSTTSKQPTAAEMREWYEKNNFEKAKFEEAMNGLRQLADITKTQTKTVSAFSKDTLKTYLQNIGSNQSRLRNLSRYLYYRSEAYHRLVMHSASLFELGARTVTPQYDLSKEQSPDKVLKDYYETLDVLDVMNLNQEFIKAYIECFIADCFYGIVYYDETGFFILPFPSADHAKVAGITSSGRLIPAFSMDYFRSRQELLEYLGDPLESMFRAYESTGEKWQIPSDEFIPRVICLKYRFEEYDLVYPPYGAMLLSIINLIDTEDAQAIAENQNIFKMLALPMKTISGTKNENDFSISPDIIIEYFNRMISEALPDYVSAAIVPGELQTISFDNMSSDNDNNRVSKATENFFNSAGSIILNGSSISGSTAFEAAIEADTQRIISTLLPQTQTFINDFLKSVLSNPSKVAFFETSALTKHKLQKNLLESCQYGLGNILAYNSTLGIDEKSTLALNYLETTCLNLANKLVPLQSSHTQSGTSDTGGAPEKDLTDLTDAGEDSRDKDTAS